MIKTELSSLDRLKFSMIMVCCTICLLMVAIVKSGAKGDGKQSVKITVVGGEEGWCGNRLGQFAAYHSERKVAVVFEISKLLKVFKCHKRIDDWKKYLCPLPDQKSAMSGKKIDLVGEWSDKIPEIPKAEKEFRAYEIYLSPDIP